MVGEILSFYQKVFGCNNLKVVEVVKPYCDEQSKTDFSERKFFDEELQIRRSSSLYSTLDSIAISPIVRLGEGSSKRWIKKVLEE